MGTRGSALAIAQSGWVVRQLQALEPRLEVETVVIKTSGDLFGAVPPKEALKLSQSTKGLFVKEIEEALSEGRVDFAVHSAKDLPSELAPGLRIAAYPAREDARDVFIGRKGLSWKDLSSGMTVATSSLRRSVQLKEARPGVKTVPMRGNVDTRLRKLAEEGLDGLLLAAAGLKRLGRSDVKAEPVAEDVIVPATGQGALAVETRAEKSAAAELIGKLDDRLTRVCVETERAFLAALGGGCATPLGAHARTDGASVTLSVFWSRDDGSGAVRLSDSCPLAADRGAFARALAGRVKARAS